MSEKGYDFMKKCDLRKLYGSTLVELGGENPDVVVLEADLAKTTMSILFQQAFPERYFEMGIAEQNMVSFAAGLALCGKKPFINSFAVFSTGRVFDQIRQSLCLPKLNVVVNGSSSGLSDFGDGATHQSFEDAALMRLLPHMTVFHPTDAVDTPQIVRRAICMDGPVYLKFPRSEMPGMLPADYALKVGEPYVLREGKDAAVFACGIEVYYAMEAAERLAGRGTDVKVIVVNTLKPVADETICALVKDIPYVVTAEEQSVIGGLASIVSYALRNEGKKMEAIAIHDAFGQSAQSHEALLEHYRLTDRFIEDAIVKLIDPRMVE